MWHCYLFPLLLSLVVVCPAKAPIWNGENAEHRQFPYQVALVSPMIQVFCGGAILDSGWIVTAAHCFKNNTSPRMIKQLKVMVGNRKYKLGDQYSISKLIVHNEFKYAPGTKHHNDIALIKPSPEITFNNHIKSIAVNPNFLTANSEVTVMGWGRYEKGIKEMSTELRFGKLKTLSNFDCLDQFLSKNVFVTKADVETLICAVDVADNDVHLCVGDFGGSVVEDGMLVGVGSFSVPGCQEPFGFTRLADYMDWIEQNTYN